MPTLDTIIRNGTIVTPNGSFKGDIGLNEGKISALAVSILSDAEKVIDAEGKYVLPGVIDPHLHIARDFEHCASETASLAFGGVTSGFTFTSSRGHYGELLSNMIDTIPKKSCIDLGMHVTISNAQQASQISEYFAKYGVASFKFFIAAKETELYPGTFSASDGTVYAGFEEIAKIGYPATAIVHAENWEIFFSMREKFIAQGKTKKQEDYIDARPKICEIEGISRVVLFARQLGCRLYIAHVSTGEGSAIIARNRSEGMDLGGETCPHYLAFTKYDHFELPAKVNPPLRDKSDNEALWRGLNNGSIPCVASDYVPGRKGKAAENVFSSSGMPGRVPGIILPMLLSEGVRKGRLSLEKVTAITSLNTAKWFGIYPMKGMLMVASDADMILVDMKIEKTVNPQVIHATSDATWYDGRSFKGWPVMTIIRGQIVTDGDELVGKAGLGRYVRRHHLNEEKSLPELT